MKHGFLLAPLTALFALGCSGSDGADAARAEDGTLSVYTVNYPLQYFAERIGGDQVTVSFSAPPDIDPADWSPEPQVIAAYQTADLILTLGPGYAAWLDRASLPISRLADTSLGFADRLLAGDDVTHTHGPGGAHSHSANASTAWLDPALAAEMARSVAAAMTRVRPESEAEFGARRDSLLADLAEWGAGLAEASAALVGRAIIYSHPVYGYFDRATGLQGRSLHWEPGEPPDPKGWEMLEALAGSGGDAVLVWEGEPLEATARGVEAQGIMNVIYSPCANRPREGDLLDVLRAGNRALAMVPVN